MVQLLAFMNEYVAILLFGCAPLTALLIAFIIVRVRGSRVFAKFPTFSIEIVCLGRESPTLLVYKAHGRRIELPAEVRSAGLFRRRIDVAIPQSITPQELEKIRPDLVLGLTRLRCEYRIYQAVASTGKPEPLARGK